METNLSLPLNTTFCGNSHMARLMQNYDWDSSVMGPVSEWPESLKQSIRIILASSYPMFVWWGPDMIMFYNDGYISVLGDKHPQALCQPGKEMWAEAWDRVGPQMERVLHRGETCFGEKHPFYIRRGDKIEETYFTYSYSPVIEPDGTIGGAFCACYEDTPQVLSERRLATISRISAIPSSAGIEESRREVFRIFKGNPNDLPFVLLYAVTEGIPKLHLYTEEAFAYPLQENEQVLSGSMFDFESIDAFTPEPVPIPDVILGSLKLPVHGLLPSDLVIFPVREAGQKIPRGYMVAGISPLLPFNEDYIKFLHLLSSQLNATVTAIRALEQERELSRRLLELDKSKTNFFSNVSHELRTPLTLILGPLETLLNKSSTFPEDDRTSLEIMHRNGLRLLKQVNNLLTFSFVEAGKYNAHFAPTDLAAATLELASTFRSLMNQGGLNFTITCNPLSEPVYVDADMWEKIVLNLLSNAYKFTMYGSVNVSLQEKEQEVELRIADTGVGIPPEDMPHLFERFHRVNQLQGRTVEGTGIGLALVSELVNLHGGSVSVTSEVGKGSCFIVTIPKGALHLPQDKLVPVNNSASAFPCSGNRHAAEMDLWLLPEPKDKNTTPLVTSNPDTDATDKPLVLLVDDNRDMQAYVAKLLDHDYCILTASNGEEALALLKVYKPALILSDVMMPVMDGVTLLNKIRTLPELAAVPFIFLSARASESDKLAGFDTGADDYMVKPFSASELVTRIRSHIRNAKLRRDWKVKEQQLLADTAQRKELLESIMNSISDAFFHVTPDLEFVYVNSKVLELTGKTNEEHIGKKVLEVYPYIKDTELYQQILKAMQSMQPATLEYYDTVLDKWFDCRLYPSPSGSSAYFADITDHKKEEQVRIETEKRFLEVANAAPVLIWMAGDDMLCNFFNNNWLEFRGRTLEEECGYGWAEGVHPDDLGMCLKTYESAIQERRPFSMEYRILNRHGKYRWLLDNGIPRFTDDGQLLGYIGACTDVTALKWAEELLSKYNTELEHEVEVRTLELQQANEKLKIEVKEKNQRKLELQRSHKQLQSLTSYLQDLRENERKLIASEIHDELGQALTALKIELSLLFDRISSSRSKYKEGMLESLGSMERALDESLVSLRKIISHLRPSMSDELELVHEIQKLVTDLEKRIGIPIQVQTEVEAVELEPAVAIEVYRVIQESVTNILKHARATKASIEISKENGIFRFRVTDNGIGFDEKALAEKRSFGLLGIRERAQRIGADLSITSDQGHGTTLELLVNATPDMMKQT